MSGLITCESLCGPLVLSLMVPLCFRPTVLWRLLRAMEPTLTQEINGRLDVLKFWVVLVTLQGAFGGLLQSLTLSRCNGRISSL